MDENLALGEFPEHFARIQRTVDEIFASLYRCAKMPHAEHQKCQAVADHAVVSKNSGNPPPRGSVRNIHKDRFGPAASIGLVNLRIEPTRPGAERRNRKKSKQA